MDPTGLESSQNRNNLEVHLVYFSCISWASEVITVAGGKGTMFIEVWAIGHL